MQRGRGARGGQKWAALGALLAMLAVLTLLAAGPVSAAEGPNQPQKPAGPKITGRFYVDVDGSNGPNDGDIYYASKEVALKDADGKEIDRVTTTEFGEFEFASKPEYGGKLFTINNAGGVKLHEFTAYADGSAALGDIAISAELANGGQQLPQVPLTTAPPVVLTTAPVPLPETTKKMLVVPTTTKAADPTGSTFPTPTLKPLADGFQRVPVKKSNPIKVTIPNIQCQPQCVHQSGVSESFEAIPWASKSESPFVALYGENECLVLVPQGNNIAPVYQKGQCPPTELKQRRGDLDAYWSLIEKTDGTFNILSAMGWSNATNGCLVKGELGSPLGNGPCVNAIAVTTSEATTTTDDPPNPASTTPAPPSTCTAATCTTTPIPVDGGGTNVGAIAGGVVAGIAVVAVAAGFAIRTSWKKRQQKPQTSFDLKELSESADKFPGYPSDATLAPIRTASAPSNFTASGPVDAGAYYSSASTVAPVAGGPAFQSQEWYRKPNAAGVLDPSANAVFKASDSTVLAAPPTNSLPRAPPNHLSNIPSPTSATPPILFHSSKLLVSASEIQIDESKPSLGEGGFGIVYVGTLHRSTRVAVKKVRGLIDQKVLKMFAREVDAWEGLVQKNILPLMAYSLDPPMLVSDLMDDGNLRQYLSRVGWPLPLGLKLLLDVATGMAYLHSKHIVHGDLKSANIMVDEQRALIADFGLSRFRQELVSSGASSSRSVLMGTPGFVAPEVLAGSSAGFPSDVYSFAMVCYEVVSRGRVPFAEQPNVAAMLYKVAVEHARPARPEGVTDAVWGLIERCWAHEPAVRPNFVQVRDELARITGHA